MIIALLCIPLIGWSTYWLIQQAAQVTPMAATDQHSARAAAAIGLEDDPDQWCAVRGVWTALDERQLIRLLKDSAP
ncbi:hypothetical protein [Nocardia sp. NPDC051570]|uniref:hypothetical protein n=1 Tax=Nocardia sp. NPDC051570 TaxID=3364324 RepID=UPI0037A4A199